jgi:hypothetical protein
MLEHFSFNKKYVEMEPKYVFLSSVLFKQDRWAIWFMLNGTVCFCLQFFLNRIDGLYGLC